MVMFVDQCTDDDELGSLHVMVKDTILRMCILDTTAKI